jgi:hypothetical protein
MSTSRSHDGAPRVRGVFLGVVLLGTMGAQSPSCCVCPGSEPGGSTDRPGPDEINKRDGPAPGFACAATREHAKAARDAGTAALAALPETIRPEEAQELGFAPEQVAKASLGTPFCVFMIRLDDLARYTPDRSIKDMLVDRMLLFPLEADGAARSSMFVEPLRGVWQATMFGGAANIAVFSQARAELAAQRQRPLEDFFLVDVPALDLSFVGVETNGALEFIGPGPNGDANGPSKPRSASAVLAELRPLARRVEAALERRIIPD